MCRLEMPGNDYYGVNRPGSHLFSESLLALDLKTGKRKWHYQTIHHGLVGHGSAVRADPL